LLLQAVGLAAQFTAVVVGLAVFLKVHTHFHPERMQLRLVVVVQVVYTINLVGMVQIHQ
jgi:hypothetical protein